MGKARLSIDTLLAARGFKVSREIRACFPAESVELTPEMLEGVSGGVLSCEDIAYCEVAVEHYHNKGYTLEQMIAEMTGYQNTLTSNGELALAELSAEYLEYMISIW